MSKKIYILLVAFILSCGASSALADRHDRDRDRWEHSDRKRNPDRRDYNRKRDRDRNHDRKDYYKKLEKQREKEYKKRQKDWEHRYERRNPDRYYAPPRPPRPPKHYHPAYRPLPYSYDRQFREMVRYATRGASNVAVWQIDDDTFIVKYFRGGRYFTQYLYPYTGRYGSRNHISVNWRPNSLWELIPQINLNINL